MSISIVVEFQSKDDNNNNEVLKICNELQLHSKLENGCSYYTLLKNDKNNNMFVEKWQSTDDVNLHNNSKHFTELVPQLIESANIIYLKRFKINQEFIKIPSNNDLYITKNVIRLVVFVEILDENKFIELAIELSNASNQEDGCLEYNFGKNEENENEYAFIELWKDDDALNNHSNSNHCKALLPKLDQVSTVKSVVKCMQFQE